MSRKTKHSFVVSAQEMAATRKLSTQIDATTSVLHALKDFIAYHQGARGIGFDVESLVAYGEAAVARFKKENP